MIASLLLQAIFNIEIKDYMSNVSVMPRSHKARNFILFLIVISLLIVSFGGGMYSVGRFEFVDEVAEQEVEYIGEVLSKYSNSKGNDFSEDIDFSLFWDTWDELKDTYIDSEDISDKQLFYGALHGMVGSIGDPYTVFMEPKIAEEFDDDLAGTFEGIGAEIGIKNDILTIIAPLPDMPAEKAGLMAGDKVFAIDDESTAGISIDYAVSKIRGEKDTNVILSIAREGEDALLEIEIKRGKIIVKSIKTELLDDGIFLIKVSNFNNDTELLFSQAVREAIESDSKGIILDLRNNPGGYLETAIEMASEWIEDGLIVVEQFADEELKTEHLARGRARLNEFPTVVLVNRGSASASEIVSGALQDHGQALVVGEKTFGKGSVQTVAKFKDGSSLKVTIAKWLTPNGRSINDEGVEPDIVVAYTAEDYQANLDPQKDVAVELINNGMDISLIETEDMSATSTEELEE